MERGSWQCGNGAFMEGADVVTQRKLKIKRAFLILVCYVFVHVRSVSISWTFV